MDFIAAEVWNQHVFEVKLANLTEVVRLMHSGQMPDLRGNL